MIGGLIWGEDVDQEAALAAVFAAQNPN